MERRSFLQGLLGVPAAAAVTSLEPAVAALEPSAWVPEWYDYGKVGILKLQFDSMARYEITVKTSRPVNDWLNQCETTIEETYGPFRLSGTDLAVGEWDEIVVPVTELTRVEVYQDDILIDSAYPKPGDGDYEFLPWQFLDIVSWGSIS